MKQEDKYVKLVEWSDEDQCYIGSCPELFYRGCHGDDPRAVFDELCRIVEEMIELYKQDGKSLPRPLSGKEFVNTMQKIA
jgi:predicted RNase H-like HicB family nuclease